MSGKNFLVPLTEIKPFIKWLEHNNYDIDIIDNTTLEKEWVTYCRIKEEGGEA